MPKPPEKLDLTEYEEAAVPFDDVLKKLLGAKPASHKAPDPKPKGEGTRRPMTETD